MYISLDPAKRNGFDGLSTDTNLLGPCVVTPEVDGHALDSEDFEIVFDGWIGPGPTLYIPADVIFGDPMPLGHYLENGRPIVGEPWVNAATGEPANISEAPASEYHNDL